MNWQKNERGLILRHDSVEFSGSGELYLRSLIKHFQLTRFSKYLQDDFDSDSVFPMNYIQVIDLLRFHESDSKTSVEDDFEAMVSIALGTKIYFSDERKTGDEYYDWHIMVRWYLQICKLMSFNDEVRKSIGMLNTPSFNQEGKKESEMDCFNSYCRDILDRHGVVVKQDDDNEKMRKYLSESALFVTIEEYYELSDDDNLSDTISQLSQTWDRKRLPNLGWIKGGNVLPAHSRMLVSYYVIDWIIESSGQWIIINQRRNSLSRLISMSDSFVEDWRISALTSRKISEKMLHEIEEWESRHTSQSILINLFLGNNQSEIFDFCSKSELLKHRGSVAMSFFIKSILFLSVGRYRSFLVYKKAIDELIDVYDDGFAIYPMHNQKLSLKNNIQYSAYDLKEYVSKELERMSANGMGVVQRKKQYQERRKKHHQLYQEFGITTSIKNDERGRPVGVLFPHQNKILSKIEREIEHLPISLNHLITYFEDLNSVLTLPYLVITTYDHILQFTRCMISIGGFKHEENWKELLEELKRFLRIFRENITRVASTHSEFHNNYGPFHDLTRNIVEKIEAVMNKEPNERDRDDLVLIQLEIRDSFLEGISPILEFPDIFTMVRTARLWEHYEIHPKLGLSDSP